MSRVLRIGGAQMGPIHKADSRQAVVRRMLDLLEQAKAQNCDFLVYPELALTTFFPRWYMTEPAEVDAWFEREMPNAAVRPLFEQAADYRIGFSFGYAELTSDGHHFNTSILVDRDGRIVGKYRKVHLPGHSEFDSRRAFQHLEKRYFEPGDLGFPVWRTMGGIIGMCICNDRRWPETYRVMGLQGVELIVLGYNTPSLNSEKELDLGRGGGKERHGGRPPVDRRQHRRRPRRRDRRRGRDRGRRIGRRRLRPRRHCFRQANHLRLRAPPPRRALRPHH